MIPDLQLEHRFLSINLQFVTPLSPFSISPPYLAEAERFAETSYHQSKEKASDAEDQEAIRWAATPTNTMITDLPGSSFAASSAPTEIVHGPIRAPRYLWRFGLMSEVLREEESLWSGQL